ncbi:hypothetical protein Zm00014a_022903 [Zea mays]|uniref:Uncharacterized protein n=1 Tax=Zea mays TaxID=4577 RepID=A0A3L6DJI5_MAIZE|nr:hypothetical protein Zm00014a_022903 [Zea mays]
MYVVTATIYYDKIH